MNNKCTSSCPKSGIKIHTTINDYKNEHFLSQKTSQLHKPVNFYNTTLNSLDLNLDHYSLADLYNLFNINNGELNETTLKNAKQIVLKMHPDKSHIDQKFFLFFSKAYKCLYGIYEFQNKSIDKKHNNDDFFDENDKNTLTNMFEKNKELKDPSNFNSWFNKAFEKHNLDKPNEDGYGDWLKSDEGIMNIAENVSKTNMNEIFETKKKQIQSLTVYKGITDTVASNLGGSLLNDGDNYTTNNYTDLRQAYTETLIPVTQHDYEQMPKFKNIGEYKAHRDKVDITPLTKEESNRILLQKNTQLEQESAALAFKYAKAAEVVKQKQTNFWGDIRQLTNW